MEQRDLIWKFRYYLKSDKNALVKFVRTVNWEEGEESKQALDLIRLVALLHPSTVYFRNF